MAIEGPEPVDLEAQRAELEAVLHSEHFIRAPRLAHLLSYLCEKLFAGKPARSRNIPSEWRSSIAELPSIRTPTRLCGLRPTACASAWPSTTPAKAHRIGSRSPFLWDNMFRSSKLLPETQESSRQGVESRLSGCGQSSSRWPPDLVAGCRARASLSWSRLRPADPPADEAGQRRRQHRISPLAASEESQLGPPIGRGGPHPGRRRPQLCRSCRQTVERRCLV